MNDKFRTFYGSPIVDVVEYIRKYMLEHKDIEILIGSDSQRHAEKQIYGVVIVLYHKGKGGHVLWRKYVERYEPVVQLKLINEVWKSVEVAEFLRENGLPKPTFIDIDLNPDPQFDSNKTLRQAIGLVEGMGYKVRSKHNGALATSAADHLVRK